MVAYNLSLRWNHSSRVDLIDARRSRYRHVDTSKPPMLTPPPLSTDAILATVRQTYGLRIREAVFLPIGLDVNAAVYRLMTEDGAPYFLKLKRGDFDDIGVAVPAFLRDCGIRQVMAPLATTDHQLWTNAHGFDWILYPYFEGRDGYEAALSDAQWVALGECLSGVHAAILPAPLKPHVPREDFSPRWRDIVTAFDRQVDTRTYDDPVAARLAAFWIEKRDEIRALVARAARLARVLRDQPGDFVLCHGDMHPGNILLGAHDALAVVDWDSPVFAPREHDLMLLGGAMGFVMEGAREDALFYRGYGEVDIDPVALAYYRHERIVADVATFGMQIFGAEGSVEDRECGLHILMRQFLPGDHVVAAAHRTYARLP